MNSEKRAAAPAVTTTADRKLIRVKGVRAQPGGPVRMAELLDGWATFPDYGAVGRRWQRIGVVLLVALFVTEYLVERANGPGTLQGILALAMIGLIVLLIASNEVSDDRAILARWRTRRASTLRAGGRTAIRQALAHQGRTRTVGEMNILLSSIGRTDPVFSTKRVRRLRMRSHWWHTTVTLELTNGSTLAYRALGVRAPRRLARVFGADRFPAQTRSKANDSESPTA